MSDKKKLTTNAGCPVADNQNVLTAGPRGPQLLQDIWFLEKLAHFDREVIPERRMHAKGSGAFGTFTVTHDISQYTRAKIFSASRQENRFVCALHHGGRGARRGRCRARHPRISPSSSTPRKATGIWSATTRRCSSSATRSSSPISTTRSSATRAPTCAAPRTTGISGLRCRKRCIKSPSS